MSLIEDLKWRYATKKYDPTRKISEEDLKKIMEAIQLSPTSYGLQLFKVLDIRSSDIRTKLQPASWGQTQIVDASHLLVFCSYLEAKDEHIDQYVQLRTSTNGLESGALDGYSTFVKGKMKEKSKDEMMYWTEKQTYIALGNAMSACAELKIDSTPIEGFEPDQYDEILGLSDKGLKAAVVLAIGHRSDEDDYQHGEKVRKPLEDIFESV